MNYAIRSGIVITSSYAMKQCSRLIRVCLCLRLYLSSLTCLVGGQQCREAGAGGASAEAGRQDQGKTRLTTCSTRFIDTSVDHISRY